MVKRLDSVQTLLILNFKIQLTYFCFGSSTSKHVGYMYHELCTSKELKTLIFRDGLQLMLRNRHFF